MNKQTIIEFINDTAPVEKQAEVLMWIERSDENRRYYNQLKNLCVICGMPDKRAVQGEFAGLEKLMIRKSAPDRTRRRHGRWLFPAVSAAAAAIITVFLTLRVSDRVINLINLEQHEPVLSYGTNCGVKGKVTLPDGSTVTLNSDSRIGFPARFEGEFREVTFEGEGYFEIVSAPDFPMRITTVDDVEIEVKGTEFNLCSYPDDGKVSATLYSGVITIFSKDAYGKRLRTDLEPHKTVTILRNEPRMAAVANNPKVEIKPYSNNDTAWKRGEIIFDDEPMGEVLKKLRRWHGVEFVVSDESIFERNLTARFKSESIIQIMEMIKFATDVDYSIEENKVTIFLE